jgi:hypothetical protein
MNYIRLINKVVQLFKKICYYPISKAILPLNRYMIYGYTLQLKYKYL